MNGNTPNEGRVEVYYENRWGTVCGGDWRIQEANVVCRQLGYPSASGAWQNAHFGRGSGPVALANVACDGRETSIDQCDHLGWFIYGCSHDNDVGVTCDFEARSPGQSIILKPKLVFV